MTIQKTNIAIAVGLACLIAGSTTASAASKGYCKWYATKAVQAYAKSKKFECNYTGPMWHGWWDGHFSWCRVTPKPTVRWGHNTRQQRLSICQAQGEN